MDFAVGPARWAALLALVGAGLLVAGVQVDTYGSQPEFHYEIEERVSEETVNETVAELNGSLDRSEIVYEFSALAPRSQEILKEALLAVDGRASRYGAGNGAPDVETPGDVYGLGSSEFFLEYRDSYYRLSTWGDTGSGFAALYEFFVGLTLLFAGVPLVLVGLALADRVRLSVATLTGVSTVVLLTLFDFGWFGQTRQLPLVVSGLVVGAVAATVVWFGWGFGGGRWDGGASLERPHGRRSWMTSLVGSVEILFGSIFIVAIFALSLEATFATAGFLIVAIPVAIAWHGLDLAARRAVVGRVGRE